MPNHEKVFCFCGVEKGWGPKPTPEKRTMASASAICDAAYRAVCKHEEADLAGVQRIVQAPIELTEMALELLVACGQIATTGGPHSKKYINLR